MAEMKQIPLRLPEDLLERINRAAGDIPRERWIRRELERAVEESERRQERESDV